VPSTKQPHRQRHRASRHELAALPTVFSYAQAREAGLSQRRIYWLRDHGWIDPLARGTYRRVVADIEADPDLTEIAARATEGTICLTSALARHDLTDAIPGSVDIALPRGRRRPSTAAPVTWHTFARETFEIGRGRLDLADEVSIGLYDAERSIIDASGSGTRKGQTWRTRRCGGGCAAAVPRLRRCWTWRRHSRRRCPGFAWRWRSCCEPAHAGDRYGSRVPRSAEPGSSRPSAVRGTADVVYARRLPDPAGRIRTLGHSGAQGRGCCWPPTIRAARPETRTSRGDG
jgi:hypothetical protein